MSSVISTYVNGKNFTWQAAGNSRYKGLTMAEIRKHSGAGGGSSHRTTLA